MRLELSKKLPALFIEWRAVKFRSSVFRNGRVYLIAPRQNATDEVLQPFEALRFQTVQRVRAALAGAALKKR